MRGPAVLLLVVAFSATWAVGLQAQADPASWMTLLESRTRVAYRYTHPEKPGECAAAPLPVAAYLVAPSHRNPIGRTWLPGSNHSRWENVRGPSTSDTLQVRIVDLWCGPTGRSVLLEAAGYYLELNEAQLAQIDARGNMTPGILLAEGRSGGLNQLALQEDCAGGSCRLALLDAEAYAHAVELAVRERQEAERARFTQGERRSEAQTAQRLQTGASVGAQMDAVLNRQRAETYQRLGATAEQANAIMMGRVLPGMTPAMVRAAIGEPRETRQERAGGRTSITWLYRDRQVVFTDGRVTEAR